MLNCTGEKGQGTPAEVYEMPSQAALGTWVPSATPRKWAPDTAVCHHSPRRVSTPANAVFAACPRRPFSPLVPGHWPEEETVVIAAAL